MVTVQISFLLQIPDKIHDVQSSVLTPGMIVSGLLHWECHIQPAAHSNCDLMHKCHLRLFLNWDRNLTQLYLIINETVTSESTKLWQFPHCKAVTVWTQFWHSLICGDEITIEQKTSEIWILNNKMTSEMVSKSARMALLLSEVQETLSKCVVSARCAC